MWVFFVFCITNSALGNINEKIGFKDAIYPQITNLPEIINSFSQLNCLVQVENYKNVNLKPIDFSIILRRLHVMPLESQKQKSRRRLARGFQLTLERPNSKKPIDCALNESSSFQSNCSYTHKFGGRMPILGSCICLNKLRFQVRTKPWNCLVQIELYPDLSYWISPKIFMHELAANDISVEYIDQSIQPQVIILIEMKHKTVSLLMDWMSSFLNHNLANNTFGSSAVMARFLTAHPKNIQNLNFELRGEITELQDTEPCFECRKFYGFFPLPQLRHQNILPDKAFLSITNLNGGFAYETNQRWYIYGPETSELSDDHRIFYGIIRHLQSCPNYLSKKYGIRMKSLGKLPFRMPHDKLFHGMASLLLEIFGNSSYETTFNGKKQCINGKLSIYARELDIIPASLSTYLIVRGEPTNRSLYRWLSLPNSVTNLKFVSCGGNRGMDNLPFAELINVYEYPVWICIILSVVLLALTIPLVKNETCVLWEMGSLFKYVLNTTKVLIEQGDPFVRSVVVNIKLWPAVGAFLLVGGVISNAYKSNNVYNMIKQRNYIPYESFRELVDNNFTIYTRIAYMDTGVDLFEFRMGRKNYSMSYSSHVINLTEVTWNAIRSEVLQWSLAAEANSSDLWKTMVNHTMLHPKLEQMIWNLISPYVLAKFPSWYSDQITYNSSYLDHTYFPNIIWNNESDILYESLRKCTKIALVTTEPLANEYGRRLQNEGKRDVYVGREVYSNISITMFLSGFVKPQVLWRMKAIVSSGLWDWWPQFVRESSAFALSETHRSIEDERPDMSGNILVIFLLLIFGCLGGSLVVCVEIGPKAYRAFIIRMAIFYAKLKEYFCSIKPIISYLLNKNKRVTG